MSHIESEAEMKVDWSVATFCAHRSVMQPRWISVYQIVEKPVHNATLL